MFGDLLGNVEKQQQEIRNKLSAVIVSAESGNGAVKVSANAAKQILDISIDKSKVDWEDVEQVQDLLLTAINRALDLAAEKEQEESKKMIEQLLPPGFGNLAGMFD
jgi:hypothetical protein